MSNFQTILVAIFLSFFVFAVLIFSGLIKLDGGSKSDGKPAGKVVIWGTFPSSVFTTTIDKLNTDNKDLNLNYVRKDKVTYQQDLIDAFARGKGPDLFIVTTDMIQSNKDFMYITPYATYPEKTFREAFIDGADILLSKDGILGFPMLIDPMVLYYNKDILSNEGLVTTPKTWDELFGLNSSLTKRDNQGTISQSMIALGQYENVNNAKDIISTLLIQNQNSIVKHIEPGGYVSTFKDNPLGLSIPPTEAVMRFFIEFSNPSNTAYSWNRSLPNSLDMFTGGKLAFYLGRASELFGIESVNPNLSFDVTQTPQIKDSNIKRTYGEIYSVVINKKSGNLNSAFQIATMFAFGDASKELSVSASLPPAGRALLSSKPTDPYLFTFFNSSIITRSWPDPDEDKTDATFSELIENVLSNRMTLGEAINKAHGQIELINRK